MRACADMLFAQILCDLASADPTPYNEFAASALKESLLKKLLPEDDDVTPSQKEEAIRKFLQTNERCSTWKLQLSDCVDEELAYLLKEEVNGFFKVNKKTSWGLDPLDLSPALAFSFGRTGPGAAVGTRHLTFYSKMFGGPLAAYDPDLYLQYRAAIDVDERWANAEMLRSQSFGLPRVVGGSRLSVVPKNVKTGRTICVEASLNGFAQLGQGLILERRLERYFGISISGGDESVQHFKNQELARLGSIDGSYATIDLSSASDSISLGLVKWLIPPESLWGLLSTRAPSAAVMGESVSLHMISSMGNGYTFPLMTSLFACAVSAAYRFHGIELVKPYGKRLGNFAVFGDDIIVRKEAFRTTMRLLALMGFQPNDDKTFSDGPFRESCGADWFRGRPVRGVYIRRLKSLEERFSAYNALLEWTERTGIKLPGALSYLVRHIPKKQRFWIPRWENPDAGLFRADPPSQPSLVRYRASGPLMEKGTLWGWSYHVRRPIASRIWSDALGVFQNPTGFELAFLGGHARTAQRGKEGRFLYLSLPERAFSSPRRDKYRTERKVTVNWIHASPRVPGGESA